MRKMSLFAAPSLVVLLFLAGSGRTQFYYSGGQQLPLAVDSNRVTLKFGASVQPLDQEGVLATIDRIVQALPDHHAIDGFIVCSLSTSQGFGGFVDSLRAVDGIDFVEPYYRDHCDSAFLVGSKFCVAFEQDLSAVQIDSINASYGAVIDRPIGGMPNVFVLRNTPASGYPVLDLANIYYELPETRYAHPEFGVRPQKHSYQLYDHYADYQPHTKAVIGEFNVASVWDFAGLTQDTVVVAVIDDGIAPHEDLPAERILPGYDFVSDCPDASPFPWDAHGMNCAGIIAASHTIDSAHGLFTASGVISLNPNVHIRPLKIYSSYLYYASPPQIAEAIAYACTSGADVISNSWGYDSPCPAPSGPPYYFDVLTDAIETAAATGRGGKGCPIIFSAGNSGVTQYYIPYPACLISVLSVGAIQLDDVRWPYSSYGAALDLVAPSGDIYLPGDVWTLDQMSDFGANYGNYDGIDCPPDADNLNYFCQFGGTSAAAPVVAGAASLLLAADSTLTAQEVYSILRWSTQRALQWGYVPKIGNIEYGHGRVDAFRAVLSLRRGDVNNDGIYAGSDLTCLIGYLFRGGPAPFPSLLLADVDCDGDVDIADNTFLTAWFFQGGPAPRRPCFEYGD